MTNEDLLDKLKLEVFKAQIQNMTTEEIKERLGQLYIESIHQQNYYQQQIGKAWGVK